MITDPKHWIHCGDGCVGGEHGVPGHCRGGFGTAQAALHVAASAFQCQKRAVALVHVPAGRLDPQRLQHTHAAATDDDFLADSHLAADDVQLAGDRPVGGIILRYISIQQQHRDATDLRQPNPRMNLAAREIHRDRQLSPVIAEQRQDRQPGKVVRGIEVLLAAIRLDFLFEVAVLIQQSHADKRQAEIAGRFAVVARQHAETAAVSVKCSITSPLATRHCFQL